MNPEVEQKAKELKTQFFILPEEWDTSAPMTLSHMAELAKINAAQFADIMIKDRSRQPKKYWQQVKEAVLKQTNQ